MVLKSVYVKCFSEVTSGRTLSAFWMGPGMGGGVSRWAPFGWKPFSSTVYLVETKETNIRVIHVLSTVTADVTSYPLWMTETSLLDCGKSHPTHHGYHKSLSSNGGACCFEWRRTWFTVFTTDVTNNMMELVCEWRRYPVDAMDTIAG